MAEAPLVRDGNVVSVTSSIVTTPPIRSGPCSGIRGWSPRVTWVRRTSGVWSSGAEFRKAERTVFEEYSVVETGLRRVLVVGSTSTTVPPGWFRGDGMSGRGISALGGVFSLRIVRACSSVWPSRLEPRQVWGEEARWSLALNPMPHMVS